MNPTIVRFTGYCSATGNTHSRWRFSRRLGGTHRISADTCARSLYSRSPRTQCTLGPALGNVDSLDRKLLRAWGYPYRNLSLVGGVLFKFPMNSIAYLTEKSNIQFLRIKKLLAIVSRRSLLSLLPKELVSSALSDFTSLFGMGRGGSHSIKSPGSC